VIFSPLPGAASLFQFPRCVSPLGAHGLAKGYESVFADANVSEALQQRMKQAM